MRKDEEAKMTTGYGCSESHLTHYVCRRAARPPQLDGRLDDPVWRAAEKSPRFVDLVSGTPGFLDTRMAALWDDDHFYVGYWVEELNVQARLTERDSFIWTENDVELFIAGPDAYYEFQINARGTIYEVFYVWQDAYRRAGFADRLEFDLAGRNVDVLGGFQDASRHGRHPRGKRWAFMDWDCPGLRAAVHVDGTLNDDRDIDRGWTVELAIPWRGLEPLAQGRPLPPKDGDVWRMDFSRFEALRCCGARVQPDPGWALNRHGVYDSHIPECFSFVHFADEAADRG
jgi:hypothetical protein